MKTTAHRMSGSPFWLISALCWPIAIVAYAGVAGLLTGVIAVDAPPSSGALATSTAATAALVVVFVALPMTIAAVRARSRKASSAPTAFVAGVLLVAWVGVHAVLVQHAGLQQAAFAFTGLLVAIIGYRSFTLAGTPV